MTLAMVFAGAGASLLAGVLMPVSDQAPVTLGMALLPVAVVLAVATYAFARVLSRPVLVCGAVFAAAVNSVLVALAHTTGGAMGDALAYVLLVAYVAGFFPRISVPFTGAVIVAFGVALAVGPLDRVGALWAVLSITLLVVAGCGRLVGRAVRGQLSTDALTGALNRRGLRLVADLMVARRRRRDVPVTVAILDLDQFKVVNDRQGHAAGDALLAQASEAWRRALRSEDQLARIGGDEFVVLMPGTAETEALVVLDRLRRAHAARWTAGVARWQESESLDQVLARADADLYRRKRGAEI